MSILMNIHPHSNINSQHVLYAQAAVLLRFEPHLKSSSEVGSKAEAKGPDVPDIPQPTGLAEARTLVRFPDTAVTAAALLVPSLHDSMSDLSSQVQRPVPLSS